MKISIELEIQPDEVALATELLSTLRLITQHVKGPAPTVKNTKSLLAGLVTKLSEDDTLDTVAAEVASILTNSSYGTPEQLSDDLLEAFDSVVFRVELVVNQQSVVPYMYLLPKLPEPFKTRVRDGLISKVLSHLTKKRPVNADRTQFFAHAEAFAVLVQIEFVSVDGAAQTIERLLNKVDTRSAAVTMLGKTVELCSDKLLQKCNRSYLTGLWKALEKVNEDVFKYDVDWITQYMGWATDSQVPTGTAALASATAAMPQALTAVNSYVGHTKTVFTMCYDVAHRHLISGGKDGNVIVWNEQGQVAYRIDIPIHYVCSMDIHPKNNMLFVCGVATETAKAPVPPCIQMYDTNRRWAKRGAMNKHGSTLISCLRCMGPETDGFVTGETASNVDGTQQELVCYYDMSRSANFETLIPVHAYKEHNNLVTCVATCPTHPNLFVSGSRDMTIRVWDKRSDKSVGMFGNLEGGTVKAHDDMITCLDVHENLLLSTGCDGMMGFWDFRHLGHNPTACPPIHTMPLDGNPILKVALTGAPYPTMAAVSTFLGLYIVDFTNAASPTSFAATLFPDTQFKPYHDIKWAHNQNYLFATGDNLSIDVFQLM